MSRYKLSEPDAIIGHGSRPTFGWLPETIDAWNQPRHRIIRHRDARQNLTRKQPWNGLVAAWLVYFLEYFTGIRRSSFFGFLVRSEHCRDRNDAYHTQDSCEPLRTQRHGIDRHPNTDITAKNPRNWPQVA
ncbi:hypothetical protein HMPREF0580_1127 [Mobiluncus mulieris ATCC 35239]|uniref:Uncharacterized protein n=1 Tax=Mobiluncus mulieris ATCC 35239 TaxID=871571 RepID=E0QQG2_9ACTO|nr:hypothetical protein [Mobiluncus mulieris]EFM46135.1 hypothetical protein HMPREF0580_1127 [Mobiluncus mulieris ATCC 35239]MBB5846438.1 hypothetical protein [Mobiluncus mulieris]